MNKILAVVCVGLAVVFFVLPCLAYVGAMKLSERKKWIEQIERVNKGEISLDELKNYEGYPDTPEHGTLLKKHLKRRAST